MLKEERSVGNRITMLTPNPFETEFKNSRENSGNQVVCMCTLQRTDGLDDECINMVLRVLRILVL